jgi:hypothetical membrane protein
MKKWTPLISMFVKLKTRPWFSKSWSVNFLSDMGEIGKRRQINEKN